MIFYLGTHQANWLWEDRVSVPLFVARQRLAPYKTLQPSTHRWALDSGGFNHIRLHHKWELSPQDYINEVRRYMSEVGNMDWAAIQDWMVEDDILRLTGLSIQDHQRRTVISYITLRSLAPEVHWIPVLQGQTRDDYLRHWQRYEDMGIHLEDEVPVGLGSVCKRQGTKEVADIVRDLRPLCLHGFGFKITGVGAVGHLLHSCDSMAWSYTARMKRIQLPGCSHETCASCHQYALQWREKVVGAI